MLDVFGAGKVRIGTHGQDMMVTTEIPMTMALLTLYDMRYAVNIPPQNRPIQSWFTWLTDATAIIYRSHLRLGFASCAIYTPQ